MKSTLFVLAAALTSSTWPQPTGLVAFAEIKPTQPDLKAVGTARLVETRSGVEVTVRLTGVPPGEHGFHVHEFGNCDAGGEAAGDHFNPVGTSHGMVVKDGVRSSHAGDMGNIVASADGTAELVLNLPAVTLQAGPLNLDGRALVLHEKPDDFGQPSGNAGRRIACGVIELIVPGKPVQTTKQNGPGR